MTSRGVQIRGLHKRYGDTVALAGLDITAEAGKILGVAGPNGAGKSTMVKILAGETPPDEGAISVDGVEWSPALGARRVAIVHQEPQLFPNLTVAENLLIGRERTRFVRHGPSEDERVLLEDMAIADVADRELGKLPLAVQQRTEIARALAQDARVFLFDEPNSALTEDESDDLFRRMHALAEAGKTVILVSHRLSELAQHADRVAVVLDGRCAGVLEQPGVTADAIARMLVAGILELDRAAHMPGGEEGPVVLRMRAVNGRGGAFSDVDLDVPAGTIVAFTGVEGSGGRSLVRAIAGFERTTGTIEVAPPPDAVRSASFVSASRVDSLFAHFSVGENGVSRLDDEITGPGLALRQGRMRELARELRERFMIKAPSVETSVEALSGGNQQKVAIAAAVAARPAVLVLEEPTRGVDIGSKAEIYKILRDYARRGHAVVLYCTEIPEVFEVAHVLYVVSDGRLSRPLVVSEYPDVEALASEASLLERHALEQGVAT